MDSLTIILGAGFSKQISPAMPITDELGRRIRREDSDPSELRWWPTTFQDGGFECWLSMLAEPQPYLDPFMNAQHNAIFEMVTRLMHSELRTAEQEATRDSQPPGWLTTLVRLLHHGAHTVVTFNYDTLVEQAITWLLDAEPRPAPIDVSPPVMPPRAIPAFRGQRVPLSLPSDFGPSLGAPTIPSFRLIKLHGSLDTYWVRGDTTGSTIVRLRPSIWGRGNGARESWDPDLALTGREPFIIPPASSKSAYYSNPVTRHLWRDAAVALSQSNARVALVGYSLPLTDLTTVGMLQHTLAQTHGPRRVQVVNPSPGPVVDTLRQIGVPGDRIQVMESIEDWVGELVRDYPYAR